MTPCVFISYAREEQAEVDGLRRWLQEAGFETWSDVRIGGGQQWWDLILDEVRRSDVVLACISPHYLASDACERERRYALDCRRTLVPLRLADLAPEASPVELSGLQQLRWRTPVEADDAAGLRAQARFLAPRKTSPQ